MTTAVERYDEMMSFFDYKGTKFPGYWTSVERLDSMETKDDIGPDDVIISSYPKTGTHWMMHLVHLIQKADNLEAAVEATYYSSMKSLECTMFNLDRFAQKFGWTAEEMMKQERFLMMSHLPYNLLPAAARSGKCKTIYISRNPKDTLASFYNFHLTMKMMNYSAPWNDFFEVATANNGKEMSFGSMFNHFLGYWEHADDANMLFLKFEDLKEDTAGGVQKIAKFLGKNLTDDQVSKIVTLSSIDAMKSNKKLTDMGDKQDKDKAEKIGLSGVFRKGIVGDWKNYFTVAQNERFDSWYREKMEGTGLDFKC